MKIIIKNLQTYSYVPNVRISGKNIIFDDNNINKISFYKNKKVFNTYDTIVSACLCDNNKYIKAKTNSYGDKANKRFQGKKKQTKVHHISICH